MLFPLVESVLPDETLLAWERYRTTSRRSHDEEDQSITKTTAKSDLDLILNFLQDEVQAEERIILASQNFRIETKPNYKFLKEKKVGNSKHKYGDTRQIASAADLLTSSKEQKQCIFCYNFHNSTDCLKVRKMSMKDRESHVEKSGCCFLCLKPGHQVRKCYSKVSCLSCGKRHHILLCHNIKQKIFSSTGKETAELDNVPNEDQALANVSKSPSVMLLTLTVLIRGNGSKRKARAIIDTASQRSYILKNTAKEMKYKSESWEYLQHSLFGGENTGVCKHDVFTVYLTSCDGSYNCHFKVLSQPVICETVPPITPDIHLKELIDYNIHVNDDYKGPIEILIGADVAGKIITGGYKSLSCGLTAMETRLGWTIMGRIPQISLEENKISVANSMLSTTRTITELWTLDTLGIIDPSEKKTKEELHESTREHFINTVQVDKDNRFVVHLPWLADHPTLPDNFNLALKRLDGTARKLKEGKLYDDYNQIFKEWAREGIIEEIPKHEIQLPSHYLPHRPVVKENSTTRIRPVFDASAKLKASPSLNDCLEKGINLVELIPNILTRFRMNKFGVTADIRKAFLQIRLQENDKNYLRFLWYDENDELKYFRHCRVVFGITSSPFLLNSVIQHHLETILEEAQLGNAKYPVKIVQKLKNSFYVDNCLTSVCNESELQQFIQVATDILAEKKFELRGWESNNILDNYTNVTNVLGMCWDRTEDTLKLNISNSIENLPERVSKRIILATAHKVFDPLGISCPVTLFPKLLLQRLWKSKLSWDQEVDSGTESEFRRWMDDLNQLRRLKIPRWLHCDFDDATHVTLHFFCDASKLAYSTAAFIRVETNDSVQVHLLQARARVAPCGKRETTINRLELLGATISARLATNILKEFQSENAYFWTDSSTVLSWIQREDVWDVFVHNRVKEILDLTSKEIWRYVPGTMNPADLPSRGCSARHFVSSKWWEGPEWLYLPPEKWPSSDYTVNEDEIAREKKKKIVSSLVNLNPRDIISTRFSSYRKTIRVLAWVCRFVHNCKNGRKKGELTASELNEAEKRMIRLIQIDSFHGVRDKRLEALNPFEDNGIICTKTAVFQRDDTSEFRTPAILPGDHPVVRSLIMEDHRRNGHVGVSQVLNSLRERFWLLVGRRAVSSVLRNCVICKRHSTKSINPPAPPLPGDRVRDAAVFQITGIDYAGPLMLRHNKKAWICLFTCAVYRCVHLELVTSLSTETFLQAFHRFAARRGKPSVVYTDNGRNFVGAYNAFASIDFKEVSRRGSDERITWKFIPPGAPWWGGWWERLIGLMKRILRKIIGKACFNYEEMCTVLCNCEAILNDRPLTVVSAESNLTAITPANFLKEIRNDLLPILKPSTSSKFIERRLRYIQNVREAFRKRFRQEYLGVLKIPKKSTKFGDLKVGDVVLIGNDQMKRILWPLGIIIELFPGSDGKIRRVRIKTQNGELIRAVQSVYPLEVSSSESIQPSIKQNSDRKEAESTEKKSENIAPAQTEQSPTITRSGRTVKIPQRLDL